MATVIRTDLDDTKVVEGFKRISASASSANVQMQKVARDSANSWVKYVDSTYKADKANRVSAEGLGFVTGALGRLSPALALVGEQSVKQLPTIVALGGALSKFVFAGGALTAIAGSVGTIALSMSKLAKNTIDASSSLGTLLDAAREIGKDQQVLNFLGPLLFLNNKRGPNSLNANELADAQKAPPRWGMDGGLSGDRLAGMNARAAQQEKVDDYTSGVGNVQSKQRVMELLALEQKRLEGLNLFRKLTVEEEQASEAYTDALKARYKEIDSRIDDLRDNEKDFANEQKARWIDEIEGSEKAMKAVKELTGEVRRAYRNDKLTDDEKKRMMGELTKAQGKYNEELNKEKQNHKDIMEAIRLEIIAKREARMEAEKERLATIKARAGDLVGQMGGENGLTNEARADPKMMRKARVAASRAVKEQVAEVQRVFAEEMDAADNLERGGINVDEQRKEMRQRRNQGIRAAKAGRGDREQDELMDQQKNILDRVVANGSLQLGQGQLQLEINQEAANQIDQTKRDIIEVQREMAAFLAVRKAVGRAANNQQRLQR